MNIRKDQLEHLTKEIERLQNIVNSSIFALKDVGRDLNNLRGYIAKNETSLLDARKKALIVRYMNACLEKGLKVDEAVLKIAQKTDESPQFIRIIYDVNAQADRIAKKKMAFYLVKKLKEMHYPNREIAKIAGYSEKYIYDLFKQMRQNQR